MWVHKYWFPYLCKACKHRNCFQNKANSVHVWCLFTNTWIIWYYLNIIVPVCVNVDIILETNHSWIFMAPLNILFNWQPCLVSGHVIAKKYGCEIHTWYYFWHFLNCFQFVEVFLSCLVHVLNIANETINQMCSRWCINW